MQIRAEVTESLKYYSIKPLIYIVGEFHFLLQHEFLYLAVLAISDGFMNLHPELLQV